jgi:hypothetical protein
VPLSICLVVCAEHLCKLYPLEHLCTCVQFHDTIVLCAVPSVGTVGYIQFVHLHHLCRNSVHNVQFVLVYNLCTPYPVHFCTRYIPYRTLLCTCTVHADYREITGTYNTATKIFFNVIRIVPALLCIISYEGSILIIFSSYYCYFYYNYYLQLFLTLF